MNFEDGQLGRWGGRGGSASKAADAQAQSRWHLHIRETDNQILGPAIVTFSWTCLSMAICAMIADESASDDEIGPQQPRCPKIDLHLLPIICRYWI
jgi:hypothetical protein